MTLEISEDGDDDETPLFVHSEFGGPDYVTEIEMPAGTLAEEVAYSLFIEFSSAIPAGTGPISPNNTNAKSHNVATDLVFTVPEPSATLARLASLLTVAGLWRRGKRLS